MARPVKEIADAISRQDAKWLSSLPGIGATTAEQIVTTLKRKVTKFAMMNGEVVEPAALSDREGQGEPGSLSNRRGQLAADSKLIDDVYQAL